MTAESKSSAREPEGSEAMATDPQTVEGIREVEGGG